MPRPVWLYDEGTAPTLRGHELAGDLAQAVADIAPGWRGDFITHWLAGGRESGDDLALRIARLKVRDLSAPPAHVTPLAGEIAYERRRLQNANRGPFGVAYDGFRFQALLAGLLAGRERDAIHIALTNRLLATWDDDDLRYHLRTIICGEPCIVSVSGLVEAPAKPREFYAARQALGGVAPGSADYELLKQQFAGRFLEHDEPRLTEVVKGYVLQAVAYHLTGEPFCDDPRCRLYNAHWQEEMLAAQLGGQLCARHQGLLRGDGAGRATRG
ncbi:MAG TPA: DUF6775 family putative metallopeptidase [Armatimonadota bacterium]|nr:DUF6775 family putative metallopeptidase [Armatimonadota bacterium]